MARATGLQSVLGSCGKAASTAGGSAIVVLVEVEATTNVGSTMVVDVGAGEFGHTSPGV